MNNFTFAYLGREEIAKLLIENGIDVNHLNRFGRPALYYATRDNMKKLADILKHNGTNKLEYVDVENVIQNGKTFNKRNKLLFKA